MDPSADGEEVRNAALSPPRDSAAARRGRGGMSRGRGLVTRGRSPAVRGRGTSSRGRGRDITSILHDANPQLNQGGATIPYKGHSTFSVFVPHKRMHIKVVIT